MNSDGLKKLQNEADEKKKAEDAEKDKKNKKKKKKKKKMKGAKKKLGKMKASHMTDNNITRTKRSLYHMYFQGNVKTPFE